MYKQNKGFTLVELIVVITILAILGSIAFVSLQGYGKSARDSARISEVAQFKAGLEIFAAQSGYYMPAGNAEILDDSNTGVLSFVGTTGEDLARITNLSEAIADPVTGVEYTYAVAGNKKQYEVYYELEAEDAGIINSASAFDATKKVVTGNYNGVFTIAEKGQVVAMPSLVTTTGTITLGSDTVDFKMSEKDTDVTFTPVKVADTVPTKIAAQKTMVEAIQTAYSGNESLSENIKEVTSLDTTKTSEIESFVIGGLGSDKVDTGSDSTPPEGGSFVFTGGASTVYSSSVSVDITCPAEDGVEFEVAGSGVQTGISWTSCPNGTTVSNQALTLDTATEGSKEVTVTFRDSNANEGTPVSSSVTYQEALYAFTSHTFTNCGATGREGPTLSQCRSSYSTSWDEDSALFAQGTHQGYQLWTVPETGAYSIETAGARGGGSTGGAYGMGVKMKGEFNLILGDKVQIIVGQQGTEATWHTCGGGGGGTFVAKDDNTLLIASGGGGGEDYGGFHNSPYTTPTIINASTGTSGNDTYNTSRGPGIAGNGGQTSSSYCSGAGAGWLTGGQNLGCSNNYAGMGATRTGGFVGGVSGTHHANNGDNSNKYLYGTGGFGGGGGCELPGGGGGGYSGGAGQSHGPHGAGGGGGSYNSGTNQSNGGTHSGHGYVTITKL